MRQLAEALGAEHKSFAGELPHAVTEHRSALWSERVHEINHELFDRGTEAFTEYALEEAAKAGVGAKLTEDAAQGAILERYSAAAVQRQLGREDGESFEPFLALYSD